MKLKSKLIPLTGLGLMSLTLMPISLTSCGHSMIGKAYDLTHNFFPTIEKLPRQELTINQVNDVYTENLLDNPEIFVQDYFWSKSWRGTSFEQFWFWKQLFINNDATNDLGDKTLMGPAQETYTSCRESISNLSVSTQKLNILDVGLVQIPTLSFTLNFDSTIKSTNEFIVDHILPEFKDAVTTEVEGRVAGEIKFHNVPFRLVVRNISFPEYQFLTQILSFDPFQEWMVEDTTGTYSPSKSEPWRIETYVQSTVFGEIIYETGLVQRIADDWSMNIIADQEKLPAWHINPGGLSLSNTIETAFTTSYFLQNISLKREENLWKK